MAIACLRLFTVPPFPPGPDFSVPFSSRRIALATLLPAAFPYLRPPDFLPEPFLFAAMRNSSCSLDIELLGGVAE